jgi:hypothetical protein
LRRIWRRRGRGGADAGEEAEQAGEPGEAPEAEPGEAPEAAPGGSGETPAPAPGGSGTSTAPDTSTPTGAVAAFYTRAAEDDFDGAWDLATPTLRQQLTGYDAFVAQQRPLKSIEFPSLEVTEQSGDTAVVTFRSIARLETKTDRCRGTIDVVRGGDGWLVNKLHVAGCTPGPPS